LQVIEFIKKPCNHKGFASLKQRLVHLYEISEGRVSYEPFTLSDEQGGRCPLVAGAKGNINASRFYRVQTQTLGRIQAEAVMALRF
jgi:hypothetical protein